MSGTSIIEVNQRDQSLGSGLFLLSGCPLRVALTEAGFLYATILARYPAIVGIYPLLAEISLHYPPPQPPTRLAPSLLLCDFEDFGSTAPTYEEGRGFHNLLREEYLRHRILSKDIC